MQHGVTAIISRKNNLDETEYLFIRSLDNTGKHTDKLYPPSGGMEGNETEEEALKRELIEELKLNILPIRRIADLPGDIPNLMLHFWECKIIDGEIEMNEAELDHIGWYTIKQIQSLSIYPATMKFFKKYLQELT